MEIVGDVQYEIMTFIRVCNRAGYAPTSDEVMLWQRNPQPREGEYHYEDMTISTAALSGMNISANSFRTSTLLEDSARQRMQELSGSVLAQISKTFLANVRPDLLKNLSRRRVTDREAETVIDHMIRLAWLSEEDDPDGRLNLTRLGSALLSDTDRMASEEDGTGVTVLGADNRIAYPKLIAAIAKLGPALLVDPYLTSDAVDDLLLHTDINRFLMNTKKPDQTDLIGVMLSVSDRTGQSLKLRTSTALHDRWVIPDKGGAFILGTSLNGVGNRASTVFCPMPSAVEGEMRTVCEQWWADGAAVVPAKEPAP